MKIANVHVGTIHRNVRIALQFSFFSLQFLYQFAILVSVCNSHFLISYSTWTYAIFNEFAIFISVCNSHVTTRPLLICTRLQTDSHVTMSLNS
jgi:hypothetical protein